MTQTPAALTHDIFVPLVGSIFTLAGWPDGPAFELVEANSLVSHPYPGRTRDSFRLEFVADTPEPEQGIRHFDIPGHGEAMIFLVPIERRGDRIVYEAVFN
ncbi:MAG: hypothetical protein V4537_05390 [Pseudomonadota bacterium]